MNAKEWLKRGIAHTDEMDKFSNFWKGFNFLFSLENGRTEKDKIKSILNNSLTEQESSALIQELSNDINILINSPIIDMRGNGRDTSIDIIDYRSNSFSLEKLKNLFMIIYQIRCNLEHGQKSPLSLRDESLVKSSNKFLEKILIKLT